MFFHIAYFVIFIFTCHTQLSCLAQIFDSLLHIFSYFILILFISCMIILFSLLLYIFMLLIWFFNLVLQLHVYSQQNFICRSLPLSCVSHNSFLCHIFIYSICMIIHLSVLLFYITFSNHLNVTLYLFHLHDCTSISGRTHIFHFYGLYMSSLGYYAVFSCET